MYSAAHIGYTYPEPLYGDAMGARLSGFVLSTLMLMPIAAHAKAISHVKQPEPLNDEEPAPTPPKPEDWSYDADQTGQEEWGLLSKDFDKCELGSQQSPIRIEYTKTKAMPKLGYHYQRSKGRVVFRNHAIEVDVLGNHNTLTEGDHTYWLRKLVFHSPSEHMVLARYWLVEIQFVHEDEQGKLLIVSVMGNMGESDNAAIRNLTQHAPKKPGHARPVEFAPYALLPKNMRGYYAYMGSLTIPPCTEGVKWRILKGAIEMSKDQVHHLNEIMGRNARMRQPVYMRNVYETIR